MILLLLAASLQPVAGPPAPGVRVDGRQAVVPERVAIGDVAGGDQARFTACAALARSDPDRAVAEAEGWIAKSHGVPARQCLGLAYAGAGRWGPAAAAFEGAAQVAEGDGDGRAAALWAQAGNAQLAAESPVKARTDLDRALALPNLAAAMRGEALLDRARAGVALQDLGGARIDLDRGKDLVAADPFAWLLSASLARRQHDLDRAETDIAEALRLAPDDAGVALEAGNIAAATGAVDAARTAWTKAVELAPNEPEGAAAKAALAANR